MQLSGFYTTNTLVIVATKVKMGTATTTKRRIVKMKMRTVMKMTQIKKMRRTTSTKIKPRNPKPRKRMQKMYLP